MLNKRSMGSKDTSHWQGPWLSSVPSPLADPRPARVFKCCHCPSGCLRASEGRLSDSRSGLPASSPPGSRRTSRGGREPLGSQPCAGQDSPLSGRLFHPGRGCLAEEGPSRERRFQRLEKWPSGDQSGLTGEPATWEAGAHHPGRGGLGSEQRCCTSVKQGRSLCGAEPGRVWTLICWASRVPGSIASFLAWQAGNQGPGSLSPFGFGFLICKVGAEESRRQWAFLWLSQAQRIS